MTEKRGRLLDDNSPYSAPHGVKGTICIGWCCVRSPMEFDGFPAGSSIDGGLLSRSTFKR